MIDYKELFTRNYTPDANEKKLSVEALLVAMSNPSPIDMDKFKACNADAAVAEMMENVVLHPDEHSPESLDYWKQKGMIKEFHGEDAPMDWEEYEKKTGNHYDVKKAFPQNLWKKWTSFLPVSATFPENKNRKYPLLVVLHGAGNTVYTVDGWGFETTAAQREWIMIVPSIEMAEVVFPIIEEAKKRYPVDESRIYLTGFSYGSVYTNILGLKRPELFAAVAPCGGFLTDGKFIPYGKRALPEGPEPRFEEPMFIYDGDQSEAGKYKLPAISIIGSHDRKRWPLGKSAERETLLSDLNFWARINDAEEFSEEALDNIPEDAPEAAKLIGLPLEQEDAHIKWSDGLQYAIGDVRSRDGVVRIRLVDEENVPHWPTPELSRLVCDFFAHFARDPQTKESIYISE